MTTETIKTLSHIGFRLSPHFTLKEMTETYQMSGNTPSETQLLNLIALCNCVLEPLRAFFKKPISINSGFRSKKVNTLVGGVATSKHLAGLAADIHCESREEAYAFAKYLKGLNDRKPQARRLQELIVCRRKTVNVVWLHVSLSWEFCGDYKEISIKEKVY